MAEDKIVSEARDVPDIGAQVSVARQVRTIDLFSRSGLVTLNNQLVDDMHGRRVQEGYSTVERDCKRPSIVQVAHTEAEGFIVTEGARADPEQVDARIGKSPHRAEKIDHQELTAAGGELGRRGIAQAGLW